MLTKNRTVSFSFHVQMCNDIEQEIDAKQLACQFCRAIDDTRIHYCCNCKSTFGTPKEPKGSLQRLAADFASRLGLSWRHTTGISPQGARGDEAGVQTRQACPPRRFHERHRPLHHRQGLRRSHGLNWHQQDNDAGMGLAVLET